MTMERRSLAGVGDQRIKGSWDSGVDGVQLEADRGPDSDARLCTRGESTRNRESTTRADAMGIL